MLKRQNSTHGYSGGFAYNIARQNIFARVLIVSFVCILLFMSAARVEAAITFINSTGASSTTHALSFVAAGTYNDATGDSASITPTLPTGWQENDLLIMLVTLQSNITISSISAGWNLLSSDTASSTTHRSYIYWKYAASNETNPTVQQGAIPGGTNADLIMGQIFAFRGVEQHIPVSGATPPTPPFDGASSFTFSGADLTTEAAAITTVTANAMILFAALMADDHTGISAPQGTGGGSANWDSAITAGCTETNPPTNPAGDGCLSADNSGNDASLSLWYGTRATAGSQAAQTATRGGAANAQSHGAQISLRPPLTIDIPSGTTTGDVMIASIVARPTNGAITPPAGWTLLPGTGALGAGDAIRTVIQAGGNTQYHWVYYKVATGAEPARYSWSLSGANNGVVGSIMSFRGVDTTSPVINHAGRATGSSVSHPTNATGFDTTVANAMVVTHHAYQSSASWAAGAPTDPVVPTGAMSTAVDISSFSSSGGNVGLGIAMGGFYRIQATAANTGVRTATAASDADAGTTHILALRPLLSRMHVVLPGQSFTNGVGVTGTPTDQTANTAFNLVQLVVTNTSNTILTSYNGAKTINYTGPSGAPSFTTAVNFTNGVSTTILATTLDTLETTTITATDAGDTAVTGITSASLNVTGRMHVVLPGQIFTNGVGVTGTPADQTQNTPFDLVQLVVTNNSNNIVTSYSGARTINYVGPSGLPSYTTAVNFTNGVSTTTLTTTLNTIETTTLTATDAGSSVITGITSAPFNVIAAPVIALTEWRMDEYSWNGTAGEVIDEAGAYNGTAVNGAQTDDTVRAVPGDPGTCGYGTFDDAGGGNGDYIEIPGFPNQTTNFTITAWINTRDNTRAGQRIFADDESNTGGYAMSVGDGGTGTLRFYSRGVTNVILDTTNVIANDTWYFVAGVADITNSARTLYIYDTGGTLVGTASDTFTGAWGTDNGMASIGGETNSGETDNGFYGNLDEVRFYGSALNQSQIEVIMDETHDCPLSQNIILSTTNNSTLGGQAIDQDEAVEYDATTNTGSLFFNDATFDANENLDAIHALNDGSGHLVISTSAAASIGGNAFNNGDLIEVAPTVTPGVYSYVGVFFPVSNFSANENIDAVYVRDNGNIVLSTAGNAQLPQCGGGNLNLDAGDLVEWDVTNTCATLVFDFTPLLAGCAGNIDGVHFLNDDENRILISTVGDCTIGGIGYQDGDVILYNRNTSKSRTYLDESLFSSGDEDIAALALAPTAVIVTVDHYAISYPNGTPGVTCEALAVRITAHADATDHSQLVAPGNTTQITISTSPVADGWALKSGNGIFLTGPGAGQARYTFDGTEQFVELWLTKTAPTTVPHIDIDITDGTATDVDPGAEDARAEFVDTVFRFYGNGAGEGIGPQIAGKESDVAPGLQIIQLRAVETNTDTGACETRILNNQTVEIGFECDNPTTCAGAGERVQINNTTDITPGNNQSTIGIGSGNYGSPTLNFGVTGTATFTFDYNDAGQIRLHARKIMPASGDDPAYTLFGSSNYFIVRPFAFSIESSNPNFTAADATGSPLVKAGENFDVTVQAVVWESADDDGAPSGIANDGVPDTGADLTGNAVTPNFGNESVAPMVDITHILALPVGGNSGTLTGGSGVGGFGSVNPGEATATLTFSEVGIIDLTASHTNYLASSSNITGIRENVGRFYPDRFTVTDNTPQFVDTCTAGANPFTYQDQIFYYGTAPQLEITALNVSGAVTQNYGDTNPSTPAERFWKLTSTTLERNYNDQAVATATFTDVQDPSVTLAGDIDFDGIGTLTLDSGTGGDAFTYNRVSEEGQFNADVDLIFTGDTGNLANTDDLRDSDGVCYDPDNNDVCDNYTINGVTGATLRFGRLVVGTAAGSELLPVTVQLQTHYFDGAGFVLNTDDACTVLTLADDIQLSNPETAGGAPQPGTATMNVGTGTSSITSGDAVFTGGTGSLIFSAPGANNIGFINVLTDLASPGPDHLQDDTDDNGTYDNNPSGRATFGVFEGPGELIYIREPW